MMQKAMRLQRRSYNSRCAAKAQLCILHCRSTLAACCLHTDTQRIRTFVQCAGDISTPSAMQAGDCTVQCLQQEPCASAPAPAPVHEHLMASQPFQAKHKYQPAPAEAPVLAAAAPAPQSNAVCSCSSNDKGIRPGSSITFQYAGECTFPCIICTLSTAPACDV